MNISKQAVGYLVVQVTTARGAIPLEGATVNVRGNESDSSSIIYSLLSDRDGRTPRISLDAPPKENSSSPDGAAAFSTYGIEVFKDGYLPLYFQNVPIFPDIISVQPAVMIPESSLTAGNRSVYVDETPEPEAE